MAKINRFLQEEEKIVPLYCSVMTDVVYVCPSLRWVKGSFAQAFASFKNQLGNNTWVEEENDCDDFSRFAAFFAQYLHHNTKNKIEKTSLAFGEIWYVRDAGDDHRINIFLYRENEVMKVGFFEPQTCKIVTLSDYEKQNCKFYQF